MLGTSYAWFLATTNTTSSDIVVTTANLGVITYKDGNDILFNNILPGAKTTKTFTISSSQDTTVDGQKYEIKLKILTNTLSPTASNAFVYTLIGTTSPSGGQTINVSDVPVPRESSSIGVGSINKSSTHTYTLSLEFKETSTDQNASQGTSFNGKTEVKPYTLPLLTDAIKKDNNYGISDSLIDFTSSSSNDLGLYYTDGTGLSYTEDNHTVYYFRGKVLNNHLKFGKDAFGRDMYWRIIRIDEGGNIKLIYNGTSPTSTGIDSSIGVSAFNSAFDKNAHVGYMYGTPGSTTYQNEHENLVDSRIKTFIDTWYEANLLDEEAYISKDTTFCNDRSISYGNGINNNSTDYKAYERIYMTKHPDFKCPQINDNFSVSKGNKKLKYPVGLITADETGFAGSNDKDNKDYYLYTGEYYWTLTPFFFVNNTASIFQINHLGAVFAISAGDSRHGVRPVIGLNYDTTWSKGDGTQNSPYEIIIK